MGLAAGKPDDRLDPIVVTRLHPHYQEVLMALHEADLTPVLIGGVAVSLLGGDRLTRDIDAVSRDGPRTMEILYQRNFKVVSHAVASEPGVWAVFSDAATAIRAIGESHSHVFRAVHTTSGLLLDIWLDAPGVRTDDLFSRARKAIVSSVGVLCAAEEDLIAMKTAAMERNPSRRNRDEQDIEFLRSRLKVRSHGE